MQQTYFPDFPLTDFGIAKGTRGKQQRVILDLFRYRFCTRSERQLLAKRAEQAAKISSKPIYVLRDLLQYLAEQCIVVPSYTVLQDIVGAALRAADVYMAAAQGAWEVQRGQGRVDPAVALA